MSKQTVLARSEATGLALGRLVDAGKLSLLARSDTGFVLEQLASRIDVLVRRGARRVFIDGVGGLQASALEPARTARALAALLERLDERGVATLVTDTSVAGNFPPRDIAGASDHALVAEPRAGGHEPDVRAFELSDRLLPPPRAADRPRGPFAPPALRAQETEGPVSEGGNKTILVVDDEQDIVSVLSEVLAEEGYSVITAANGLEALERMADSLPDLVLLDLMMPVMSGDEFLEELDSAARSRPTPVVLMSAADGSGIALRHQASFLKKPFDIEALLATVKHRLAG